MQNLNIKVLKGLAIAITVVLCIMLLVIRILTKPPKEEEIVILDAINNGERIVHYSGEVYCPTKIKKGGKIENVLIRMPINFDDSTPREIIKTFVASVDNIKLNFLDNKLLYKDYNTYIYDLQKKEEYLFSEGELQFLFEPNGFVMLQNGDLYKATYYTTTYMAKNLEKIATGDFIKIGEDEEKMYYSSISGQSNTIVVALDKVSLRMTTLDNINTRKQTLEKAQVTDDYVYAFMLNGDERYIRRISKELDKEGNAEIVEIPIDMFDKIETIDTEYAKPLNLNNSKRKNSFNDLYFYGSKISEIGEKYGKETTYATKMYKYSFDENTVTEYTGGLNELHAESYSGDINGTIVELYYGGKKITEIDTNIPNLNDIVVNDVEIVSDGKKNYLYYDIRVSEIDSVIEETTKKENKIVKNSDIILARTLLEGGESQRINIITN